MIRLLLTFLLLKSIDSVSQIENRKKIRCKIIAENASVEGVNVLNLLTEQTTISNEEGEFYILAKTDDLLLITAVNLEIKRKLIEDENLEQDVVLINMIPKTTILNEVKINTNSQINAVTLGIVSKDQKKYTPAERRLKTAGDFKPIHLLGLLGGSLQVDPIINAINGKTKQLKNELAIEKKEYLLTKLDAMFKDDYYTDKLHVPVDYVDGFKYYIIEDESFVTVFLSKDKPKTAFKMGELAINYNQIIVNENN